ncbi:MAG: DoxX family protein [Bacteroidetes bacterium]|nr:DoxX family protein [Bacteroidota bacterium]MBS1973109.1 DoxX family protein [Bacteroidota bacterium]
MKKILSTAYTDSAFNIAALVLRAAFGALLLLNHGVPKLKKFGEIQRTFFDPFHIGHLWSLMLVLFAEIVCSALLVLGLLSRLAALVIVIQMSVLVFIFHKGQPIAESELAVIYLAAFFTCLLIGPGRYSVDAAMGK